MKKRGCDYITASSGGSVPEQQLNVGPGYQVPFAERIRRGSGIATMAVGLITEARQAEEIIASGKADMVALGRGMLFNPRWPWHAAMELGEQVYYPPQYERSHPQDARGRFPKTARRGLIGGDLARNDQGVDGDDTVVLSADDQRVELCFRDAGCLEAARAATRR